MEGFLFIDFKTMLPRFILMWFSILFKKPVQEKSPSEQGIDPPTANVLYYSAGWRELLWMSFLENTPT